MPDPARRRPLAARCPRRLADTHGLTVLEILVALAILVVALGAIYGVVRNAATSFGINEDLLDAQQNARLGLERLVEEARWTRRVVAAGPSRLDLEIVPENPRFPGCTYTVRFAHNGSDNSFDRSVLSTSGSCPPTAGTESIASFVTGLAFTYCDAAGTCGGGIPLGAIVRVEAQIEVTKGLGPLPQRRTVSGAALLRNIGAAGAATPTPAPFTAPWRPTPGQTVVPPPTPPSPPPSPTVGPTPPPTAPPTPRPPTVAPTPRPPTVPPTVRPTPPPTVPPTVPPPTPTWTPPRAR